ncbi:MAG: hypothetical protein ACOCX4_02090 [Planctomycetota bacterium]
MRGIEDWIPAHLIRVADERYADTGTEYLVVVGEAEYGQGTHLMMVAYEERKYEIFIVTAHPLSQYGSVKTAGAPWHGLPAHDFTAKMAVPPLN